MSESKLTRERADRIAAYIGVSAALVLGAMGLQSVSWSGSSELHTLMEAAAMVLAFTIGVWALFRFRRQSSSMYLFIATGFIGAGVLDGYHCVVTSTWFHSYSPSSLPSLITWSWLASRIILSVFLFLSWLAWWREDRRGGRTRSNELVVYLGAGWFTLLCLVFFALVPLPRAYYEELFFHRPEEFLPAVFFGLALFGYVSKGEWRKDPFEHWIVLSLLVGLVAQTFYMSRSSVLFDMMFDTAHLLKIVAYGLVLIGLLVAKKPQPAKRLQRPAGAPPKSLVRLGSKIGLAFGMMALVVSLSTLVTIWNVRQLARSADVLSDERLPTTEMSLEMLNGVNASLAELRGWVLLGKPEFKERRAEAWETQILPALAQLNLLSNDWDNELDVERVRKIREHAGRLSEYQQQIERLANSPEDQPANRIFFDEALPLAAIINDCMTEMIDAETQHEATSPRKRLIANMGGFRSSMALCVSNLRAYLLSAELGFKHEFEAQWEKSDRALAALDRNRRSLTIEQSRALDAVATARQALEPLARRMLQIRSRDDWDRSNFLLRTKAAPEADAMRQELNELLASQRQLMDSAQQATRSEITTLSGVQWFLLVFGLGASLLLGVVLTRTMVEPIDNAVTMADAIAAGDLEFRTEIHGSVEAESLGRSLSRMASNLAAHVERTKHSERQLRHVVEASSNGMVMVDGDGTIVLVNRRMEEICGHSRDEMVGKPIENFLPVPRESQEDCDWNELVSNPRTHRMGQGRDLYAMHKSGRAIPVEVGLTPVESNGGIRVLATVADITERKRAEDELRQANEKLHCSNQELEQFAYVASHDLQEPLRKVSSFCSILLDDYGDKLDEDGKRYVGYAVDGAARMRTLIQDLLAFSRIQSVGRELEPIGAQASLDAALSNLALTIEESQARVTSDPLPVVTADATQLTQLLQNLIGNGLKYRGDESPRIHVALKTCGQDWLFSVSDNGIGIAPEFQEQVFGIFKRLHGRNKYSGTGIGLAICKRIVEGFRGRIWIESEAGEGATFFFTIPKSNSDCSTKENDHEHDDAELAEAY